LICEVCQAIYPDTWPQPIRCSHTRPGKDYRPKAKPAVKSSPTVKPNAWQVIHTRYADAIQSGQWDEASERQWLNTEFPKLIPASCGCGGAWKPISDQIDLSTPEAAFRSTWQAHNTVSTEHVKPAKQAISYERCRALYLPQPSLDIASVTSLSPRRFDRQTLCLNTWKQFGLTIHCVQTADEIEQLKPLYPMVDQWHEAEESPPYIWRLARVADSRSIVINSDIEIHGEQATLLKAFDAGVPVGIRHNYDSHWWTGEAEKWGIDVFGFTPEIAATLPQLPLQIGKPMWDYFVPHHFRVIGVNKNWINEPLFFHAKHELNWTQDDWQAGADVFTKHYGFEDTNWAEYRKQL
jgi:hypothetical protein